MRFYRISRDDDTTYAPVFVTTFRDAHTIARSLMKPFGASTFVDEVELPATKEQLDALLNGRAPKIDGVLRSWGMTARGGLVEVEVA